MTTLARSLAVLPTNAGIIVVVVVVDVFYRFAGDQNGWHIDFFELFPCSETLQRAIDHTVETGFKLSALSKLVDQGTKGARRNALRAAYVCDDFLEIVR